MDGQDVQDVFPAVDPAGRVRAVLVLLDRHEVEDFEGGLVGGEMPAPDGGLAEPGVERFYGVRGVHDLAELDGEVQKRFEVLAPLTHPWVAE